MREFPLIERVVSPGDRRRGFHCETAVESRCLETIGMHRRDLAIVEMYNVARMAHERGRVGGDEHLLLTDAERDRPAVARRDDRIWSYRVEHCDRIGTGNNSEYSTHRFHE